MIITSIDVGTTHAGIVQLHENNDRKPYPFEIHFMERFNMKPTVHATMNLIVKTMVDYFQSRLFLYNCDLIVIESQGFSTPYIKSFFTAIYSHFLTLAPYYNFDVRVVHPSIKMEVCREEVDFVPTNSKYMDTKMLAVAHLGKILEQMHPLSEIEKTVFGYYSSLERQHDLADAALLGAAIMLRCRKESKRIQEETLADLRELEKILFKPQG